MPSPLSNRSALLVAVVMLMLSSCTSPTPGGAGLGGDAEPASADARKGGEGSDSTRDGERSKAGSGDQPDESGDSGAPGGNDGAATAGLGGEPKISGPDVLDVAIQEPATLDPMRIQDPGSALVARQLYDGLTRWDAKHGEVRPAAARSWRELQSGSRFVFKLRGGMRFHDGSPVTASDFKFAFERIARKRSASDLAYTLELVKGFAAVNQFGDETHLAGVRAPDARTLIIKLSEPYRDFPAVLTHPALVPLERDAVAKSGSFARKPVGNGPFKLAGRWSPGRPIALEAFTGGARDPKLDGIRFVPYPDAAASWPEFVEESLDIAEVPAGEIETARQVFGDEGYKPLLAGYYYGFNIRSDDLDSERLRRAIGRAIDRQEIATGIYDRSLADPRGIVPAGIPGFSKDACKSLCDHSTPAARRLVKELPRGRRQVTLEYTRGRPHGQVAHAVKRDLSAAGLEVKVRAYDFGVYLRRLSGPKHSMYRLGWIAEYPVADVFLSSLFESSSPDNHSGLRSDAVDELLARAHRTASEVRRAGLYRRAEAKILKHAPIVPIGSFVTRWAAQDRVQGVNFDVMGGFDAARVGLD